MVDWVLIALASLSLVSALSFSQGGETLNDLVYDRILWLRAPLPSDQIIIVAIDNASLKALGKWPWSRQRHVQLLNQLADAHPHAVAYDVLFTEASSDDGSLARAEGRVPVYLPVLLDQQGNDIVPVPPVPPLAQAAKGIGQVNVHFDPDSLVRRADPFFRAGGQEWPHLMALMAGRKRGSASIPIAFQPEPGMFRTISFVDAMRGQVPPVFFRDKFVLVGATADGRADTFSVPLRQGGKLAGIEMLANFLNTILAGEPIHIVGPLPTFAVALVPLLVSLYGFWFWRPRTMVLIGSGLIALLMGGSVALFALTGWWIGPVSAVAGLLLAYPIWGWRRLAALSTSIEHDLALSPEPLARRAPSERVSVQQQIIASVGQQNAELKSHAEVREQALQALSHDMRAPQAGIIMLVESAGHGIAPGVAQRLTNMARRTMALADSFVQMARINETRFAPQEIDLANLLCEALDECYPASTARGIDLRGEGLDSPHYIMAEPGLLLRALLNLLDNAIKYSPAGGRVRASMVDDGQFIRCIIHNEGGGMNAQQVEQLFNRFSAIGGARSHGLSGSGLGLALVKSVLDRHEARIDCTSIEGQGTTFTLRFAPADESAGTC